MLKLFTKKQRLQRWGFAMLALLFIQFNAIGQDKTISGKVTDNKGESLPGVSIVQKGEKAGTSTDGEGNFRLKLTSSGATLVFNYIGYERKEVVVEGTSAIKVVLTETEAQLTEVVVVGYGIQKKASVVGSVAQINGSQIRQAPAMNISNALAGRLPGLVVLQQSGRPGADDAALRIRGISTFGSNVSPLLIVDGVQRAFSQLDPDEIEDITILKDAISTAVYGLQAANGVILVTTRRGKLQETKINYDGSIMVSSNTRVPEFLNGPDYMDWFTKAEQLDNEYNANTGAGPLAYTYTQQQIDALRNGTNTNPLLGNTDWMGLLVGNSNLSQHHDVNVQGGTDKVKYFSSVGYLDQEGVVANTGYTRYNLRTNIDAQVNKYFSVSLDLSGRTQKTKTPGISPDNTSYFNPYYQAARMLPNMPMYAENGLPIAYNSNGGWANPIASVNQSGYQLGETNVFQSTINFNFKVPGVEGLALKLLGSYDKNATENKSWLTPYEMMGRARGQTTGNLILIANPPGITVNTLRQSYNQNNRQTLQPSISYSKTIKNHSISALALYEWSKYNSNVFSTGARNFIIPDLQEIDYGSSATNDFISPTGSSSVSARQGYVGRINYGYKSKYLLEVATRFDASNSFPAKSRWGAFPAVGVAYVISQEPFFSKLTNTITSLKFKASQGRLGNDQTNGFQYLQTFSLTTSPVVVIGGVPTAALFTGAIPNENITWEKSDLTNVGFESELWNGKFGFDFEWFYKVTKDILMSQGGLFAPSVGGYYPSTINSGIVDNRGFDLQIRHRNQLGKFHYSLTGNLNWAKNKIIRMDENPNLPSWQRRTGNSIGEKLGFVVDGFYQNWEEAKNGSSPSSGTIAPGFFKYEDLNGDGRVTRADDMTFVGHSNLPELMYGLNIELQYKGFDFSSLFQGAGISTIALAGLYEGSTGVSGIEDNSPFTKTFYGYGNSPYYLVEQSWTPDNPNATYPRLTSGNIALSPHNANANSGFMVNNNYLRLKSLQLGYTIPKSVFRSAINQCRVYVTGSNLFTWDKLKYIDPEMPNVNNGFYPQQRIIAGGVNLTF